MCKIVNVYRPWDGGTDKLGGRRVMDWARTASIRELLTGSTASSGGVDHVRRKSDRVIVTRATYRAEPEIPRLNCWNWS